MRRDWNCDEAVIVIVKGGYGSVVSRSERRYSLEDRKAEEKEKDEKEEEQNKDKRGLGR